MNFTRPLAALAVTVLVSFAGVGVTAAGPSTTPQVTGKGAGDVKLKARYTTIRRQGLVGKIRPGCELGGGNTRSARLKKPLRGQVDFTLRNPRRVASITITGGATARGVGVGSTLEEIQAAFPNATVNHDTDEVFGVSLVTVPKSDGGRFEFAVSTTTGKATAIGIPRMSFCE
jgi:hypothetical protein